MNLYEIFGRLVITHHDLEDILKQLGSIVDKIGSALQSGQDVLNDTLKDQSYGSMILTKLLMLTTITNEYSSIGLEISRIEREEESNDGQEI